MPAEASHRRGPAIADMVLDATLGLLATRGYVFSIEEVAAAGVHETTVYRRWETKAALAAAAVGRHEAFLADRRIVFRGEEPAGIQERWRDLAVRHTASPKLWMDAYLAAFASAAACTMVTTDAAFGPIPELDLLVLRA